MATSFRVICVVFTQLSSYNSTIRNLSYRELQVNYIPRRTILYRQCDSGVTDELLRVDALMMEAADSFEIDNNHLHGAAIHHVVSQYFRDTEVRLAVCGFDVWRG
jgi:hypothetical protein